jgi:hypothetical protein
VHEVLASGPVTAHFSLSRTLTLEFASKSLPAFSIQPQIEVTFLDGTTRNYTSNSELLNLPEGGTLALTAGFAPEGEITSAFLYWAGDITSTQEEEQPNPIEIELDEDRLIIAWYRSIYHTADYNRNFYIGLSELLALIQLFSVSGANGDGFECAEGEINGKSDDGYQPYQPLSGDRITACALHDADYNPLDWNIGLSELLRIVQFFNSHGYSYCPNSSTEDGFCPGAPPGTPDPPGEGDAPWEGLFEFEGATDEGEEE